MMGHSIVNAAVNAANSDFQLSPDRPANPVERKLLNPPKECDDDLDNRNYTSRTSTKRFLQRLGGGLDGSGAGDS
jgi:hypothetical protein